MFEAVIFDLDGLLVDSEYWQWHAWNEYLKQFNVEVEEDEAPLVVERRDFANAEIFRRRFDLDVDPLTMAEQRQEIFFQMAEEHIEVRPGALGLIEMLKDNSLRLAIVSAGVREYIYLITDKLGLEEAFDVIVAGDMVEATKPNPMPFLACAETFGLHPSYCLVLDDSRQGVEAANSADMKVICVPGNYTERWRVKGADMVLNSLEYINMPTLRSLWRDAADLPRLQPQLQPQVQPRSRYGRRW